MMNFIKKTAFIFGFIALFVSCTEDEGENYSCYTCQTTQTEYCYTVGNTYYVSTDADGTTHQTELNGASWSDTQDVLENQCNGTNFNILGVWKMIDIHGTSTNVVTFNDADIPSITSITTQTMISSDVEINFIEDNTYTVTGSAQIHSVTTTDDEETSNFNYDSNPENGGWQINGNQITISSNGTESTGTIINQSDTHFTIKSIIHNSQDNAAGNSTTDGEFFQVYEKQ